MKQHDDDAPPPQLPRLRRRPGAQRSAWPFPTGSHVPHDSTGNEEVAPAPAAEPPGTDADAPGSLAQPYKP